MATYESRLASVLAALAESGKTPGNFGEAISWYTRSIQRYAELERDGHLSAPSLRKDFETAKLELQRYQRLAERTAQNHSSRGPEAYSSR